MAFLSHSVRLRLGALVLLASVLSLALRVPGAGGPSPETRPASWLEAQVASVSGEASEAHRAFDRALTEAREAPTARAFMTTFLRTHARLTDASVPRTAGLSARALVRVLREQLAQSGLDVRPPAQASAPPAAPVQHARWSVAAVVVPVFDPVAAADGPSPRSSMPVLSSSAAVARVASASVVGAHLIQQLFAGRPLGP